MKIQDIYYKLQVEFVNAKTRILEERKMQITNAENGGAVGGGDQSVNNKKQSPKMSLPPAISKQRTSPKAAAQPKGKPAKPAKKVQESKESLSLPNLMEKALDKPKLPEIVNLNVGGTHRFTTTRKILCQCKESRLSELFEDPEQIMQLMEGEKDNGVFIDRDGSTFINLVNYLRSDRKEVPIFENTKDEHLFYRELQFWGFPDFSYLEKRLKFPEGLADLFRDEPQNVDDNILQKWRNLGPLNIYDLVSLNSKSALDARTDFNPHLEIKELRDPIFIYYGQVDQDNKRSGFGRYISLFNGSIYEGHCKKGQQNGYGRLINGNRLTGEGPDHYIGYWKDGLRHGGGK